MYSFKNDYSEGCHPKILEAMLHTNQTQQPGYGDDDYCNQAKEKIKRFLNNSDAEIFFTSGGTQANLLVIAALLKAYESVVSAKTGHINVHEAGAIEATGHKIDYVDSADGKLTAEKIQLVLDVFEDHHMAKPKMVYISNSTELGTVYKKAELEKLSAFCKKNNLFLFMDGARLGSALCAKANDLTLADISKLTDVFYIGGTKNGALLGEAIVFNNVNLSTEFLFHLKQRGALLAKGRVLGVQFNELFSNNLYFNLATHANQMAAKMADAIKQKGHLFVTEPESNQLFPILPNQLIEKLLKEFEFYVWKKVDHSNSIVRLVTSWATPEQEVDGFIKIL